jgi:hypothetical protein
VQLNVQGLLTAPVGLVTVAPSVGAIACCNAIASGSCWAYASGVPLFCTFCAATVTGRFSQPFTDFSAL